MSWLETFIKLSPATAQTIRAPEIPVQFTVDQITTAATKVLNSHLLDYTSADISPVARLHTPMPFRSSNSHFRSAVMLEPGRAFGLADDLVSPALDKFCSSNHLASERLIYDR